MVFVTSCSVLVLSVAIQIPGGGPLAEAARTAHIATQETPGAPPQTGGPVAALEGAGNAGTAASAGVQYVPPTGGDRLRWVIDSTVGPRAVGATLLSATWFTGWNSPHEWGHDWRGFGIRLANRPLMVGLSNTLEATTGALWGEDPRYPRSPVRKPAERVRHVFRNVLLTRRRDGRLRFGYARLIAIAGTNSIAHAWLPPSADTWSSTVKRVGYGYLARLAGNAFQEFWPEIRRYVLKRPPKSQPEKRQQ